MILEVEIISSTCFLTSGYMTAYTHAHRYAHPLVNTDTCTYSKTNKNTHTEVSD